MAAPPCCAVRVRGVGGGDGGCSGLVLSRRPALVLCHAAVFAPFLRAGPAAWARPAALPPAALRPRPRLSVVLGAEAGGLREFDARLLALVPCATFRRALERGLGRADRWRFGADGEAGTDPRALPWFAWLQVLGLDAPEGGWAALASAGSLRKGQALLACGSPFGDLCPELFLNTLSRGVVSNLAGEENALVLTDARCLPGTEGGAAFVPSPDGPRVVAVIATSFCWKGAEWVGLTLLCSLAAILRSSAGVLGEAGIVVPPVPAWVAAVAVPTSSGQDPWAGRRWDAAVLRGRVVFATEESSPFDVAVVELEESVPGFVPPCLADTFLPGEEVSVVGFGALGRVCGPSVTAGVLSAVVAVAGCPVMLQTTCAVHGGSSGGPLVSSRSGCLMGIVASNTRDTTVGATYPHLNFCIPITILKPLIARYRRTGDPDAFAGLNRVGEGVRATWQLQQHTGPPSKL
ncbi:hypothetical protein DUI87_11980 [Hirundo rustica rustica]|uniref:Peroxisomal leader peptide-processing protease n=1 Tax=Hirundo rustica rustica TaxID=333673 RepID=A0A3M0KKU7_HIRRU|nr:hypothetical protein DUI87_11980 [Hirundo rustica rustica]